MPASCASRSTDDLEVSVLVLEWTVSGIDRSGGSFCPLSAAAPAPVHSILIKIKTNKTKSNSRSKNG